MPELRRSLRTDQYSRPHNRVAPTARKEAKRARAALCFRWRRNFESDPAWVPVAFAALASLIILAIPFADIPKNLPGIVFISATTTAVAQGITMARGAKGAGPIQPSVADFVATGGLVAAERFQFFIWTLVGVFTFLFLVVLSDPANVSNLPRIPDGFLALLAKIWR